MRTLTPALRWLVLGVFSVVALLSCGELMVVLSATPYLYANLTAVPKAQVALVLGASIYPNGTLSPVLKERADAAVALYVARRVQKILVSGDNGTLQYNEVYPVGKYLVSQGIRQQDIFLDYAGFDTYSSLYRAKYIFGVSSIIITSQRFHLPRALLIAHALGIPAVGLDVSVSGEYYIMNALRELPATVKAEYDLLLRRVPQYMGTPFSVSGDGSATWVGPNVEMVYFAHQP